MFASINLFVPIKKRINGKGKLRFILDYTNKGSKGCYVFFRYRPGYRRRYKPMRYGCIIDGGSGGGEKKNRFLALHIWMPLYEVKHRPRFMVSLQNVKYLEHRVDALKIA